MILCGNSLPWLNKVTLLSSTITDEKDCLSADMKIKKAKYVSENVELNREFALLQLRQGCWLTRSLIVASMEVFSGISSARNQ